MWVTKSAWRKCVQPRFALLAVLDQLASCRQRVTGPVKVNALWAPPNWLSANTR